MCIRIIDNASWHTGRVVKNLGLDDLLCLNQPHRPMYNLIEGLFSYVKATFASRRRTGAQHEEMGHIFMSFKSISPLNVAANLRWLLRTYIRVPTQARNDYSILGGST